MNTTQRFPLMLELWMAFEHMLYKAPRGRDLFDAGRTRESEYEVLYNGAPGIANLWNTLLSRQTPHLQIVRRGQDARVHVIAESHVAIPNRLFFCDSLSLALTRQRLLLERARHRLGEAESPHDFPVVQITPGEAQTSNADAIRFAVRHLCAKVINQFRKRLSRRDHWGIALHAGASPDGAADAQWWLQIPSPLDRFYADPFPWRDANGRYHLFFEDLPYSTHRGVISHVALDPVTKTWDATPQVVLERPYHLSYPFIFEHEGEVFMIPETSENRTIEVYRAAPFPSTWELHTTLMSDVVAADTTLVFEAGKWWMFTTIEQGAGPNWDELHLYHGSSPFGPWTAHPQNPIVSDCRRARMAGNIFRDANGRLIRPAQDCEREYGAALWFCEIIELNERDYMEKPVLVKRAAPERSGLHTWNKAGEVTAVDIKMNIDKRAKATTGYSHL